MQRRAARSPGTSRWGSREERGQRWLKVIVRYEMGENEEGEGKREQGKRVGTFVLLPTKIAQLCGFGKVRERGIFRRGVRRRDGQ